MKKSIVLSTILSSIILVGCAGTQPTSTTETVPATTPALMEEGQVETGVATDSEKMTSYTLSDIATHATAEDCWTAIEGEVYDLSPYIAKQMHPGGAEILKACGIDGSELFNERPGSGTPHSAKARSGLVNLKIGTLASE